MDELIKARLEQCGERYLDKNTPSGLNQKDFQNFPELVRDIPNFLQSSIQEAYERGREENRLEILNDYTNYLLDAGYVDADVYAEEPTATNGYLDSKRVKGGDKSNE